MLRTSKLKYRLTNEREKRKVRVIKTVLIHMGLLISSVLLIFAETKFVTHSANKHVSRFYADDFRQIKTRKDLNDYLKLTLPEKWQNQDENGNQNEYSRNNGIVHITESSFQVVAS